MNEASDKPKGRTESDEIGADTLDVKVKSWLQLMNQSDVVSQSKNEVL